MVPGALIVSSVLRVEAPITVRSTVTVRRPFLDRVGGWLETFFQTYRGGNPALGLAPDVGAMVDLLVAEATDMGFKAIINNKHWGLIHKNEVFKFLRSGKQEIATRHLAKVYGMAATGSPPNWP